ncbi:MAG TPA: flagellar basal body-associated FliL family protein [Polyangiaceae bacterium]
MADPAVAPASETPAAAPKRNLALPIIIAAGLIIGGSAGALVLGPRIARARTTSKNVKAGAKPVDSTAATGRGVSTPDAPVHLIDNLVLNPAGSGGTRFLLASVGLQTTSAAANDIVNKREVEARDVVLAVLGAKHVEVLAEISNREKLKAELQTALDSLFGPGIVRRIYFPQFVIQ